MNQDGASKNRSTFVTVVAWIFIVFAAQATVISLMQNVMLMVVFSDEDFAQSWTEMVEHEETPASAKYMFSGAWAMFFGFFIVSLVTLLSAIGLLRRRNWARRVFIFLLSFGIAWSIGSIAFIFLFGHKMADVQPDDQFITMMRMMQVMVFVWALGFSALLTWIIKKLLSPQIRQEFVSSN